MKCGYTILLFLLASVGSLAQGKIMLVGGGSEDDNGWSDAPYAWAVNSSANKKVAVISYSTQDNWIPDYFESLGAVEAENIKIDSRDKADLQSTYDALMEYDVFFFKGGDQSIYYDFYKETKTAQAIVDKFNAGGVIGGTSAGMAILSNVIFSAQNGSVYPDEALQNFQSSNFTLVDDFLPFLPGVIVDSHFTERGRGARLLAFMANWFVTTDEQLTGIGVDDRTALCIDENKIATVLGTGSVSIYSGESFSAYLNTKPLTDSVHVTQLLHGHSIDLDQLEIIEGPEDLLLPLNPYEEGNYEVIISGSEGLSTNSGFMEQLVNSSGELTDSIVVVTAEGKAGTFIQRLNDMGAPVILVETTPTNNDIGQIELRNNIRRAKKVLFVENDDNTLFNFLSEGPTGTLLRELIKRNGIISAFVGEDSRYAGESFVTNHLSDAYAAYYGRLNYEPGLSLLPSTTIMSNTFDASTTDFYENTTASIPFAMVSDSVKYGVYLNRKSYLRFYQEEHVNYFHATGDLSTMILINAGTEASFAATRDYVGFSSMQYVLLNGDVKIKVGEPQPSVDESFEFEQPVVGIENEVDKFSPKIFPNPSGTGMFHISSDFIHPSASLTVSDFTSRILVNEQWNSDIAQRIDLSSFANGIYYLTVRYGNKQYTLKMLKGL